MEKKSSKVRSLPTEADPVHVVSCLFSFLGYVSIVVLGTVSETLAWVYIP